MLPTSLQIRKSIFNHITCDACEPTVIREHLNNLELVFGMYPRKAAATLHKVYTSTTERVDFSRWDARSRENVLLTPKT